MSTTSTLRALSRAAFGALSRSSNHSPIEHVFGFAMLYLDNPDIGVALPLAGNVGIRVGLGDGDRASGPHPQELAILSAGLRQHRTSLGAAAVELEHNSSGIPIAAGY
jgi:hypothetical protein